jgi:hypothetical protein
VAIVRKDEFVGGKLAFILFSLYSAKRENDHKKEQDNIAKAQALNGKLRAILVEDDADVLSVFQLGDELLRIGDGCCIGKSGFRTGRFGTMTDNNPVTGKDHLGDIMMIKAVEKFTVISFWKAIFNVPCDITAAGKDGEKKKDKQVADENSHEGVPWIKKGVNVWAYSFRLVRKWKLLWYFNKEIPFC